MQHVLRKTNKYFNYALLFEELFLKKRGDFMGIYKAVRDGFKKAKTRFLFGSIFNILSSFILIYLVVLMYLVW